MQNLQGNTYFTGSLGGITKSMKCHSQNLDLSEELYVKILACSGSKGTVTFWQKCFIPPMELDEKPKVRDGPSLCLSLSLFLYRERPTMCFALGGKSLDRETSSLYQKSRSCFIVTPNIFHLHTVC